MDENNPQMDPAAAPQDPTMTPNPAMPGTEEQRVEGMPAPDGGEEAAPAPEAE